MNPDNLDPTTEPLLAETISPSEFGQETSRPSTDAPAAPPKVIIEYRTKGLPWPLVVPLVLFVSLVFVIINHRAVNRSAAPIAVAASPPLQNEATQPDELAAIPQKMVPEPLTLSSQSVPIQNVPPVSIPPEEFVGPPLSLMPIPKLEFVNIPSVSEVLSDNARFASSLPIPSTLQTALAFAPPISPTAMTTLPPLSPIPAPTASQPPEPKLESPRSEESPLPSFKPVPQDSQPAPPEDSPNPATVPPLPEKLPSREEVLAGIQREADQKRVEQLNMQRLKEESPAMLRRAYLAKLNEQRPQFLAELRAVLREKKGAAGQEIGQLHHRYNEAVDARSEEDLKRLMKRFSGRTSLQSKIKSYRALGIPEPVILELVCKEIHRREHSSRCTLFEPEMYVLAARELLAAELTPRTKARDNRTDGQSPDQNQRVSPARSSSTGNRAASRTQ